MLEQGVSGAIWTLVLVPTIIMGFRDTLARWYNEAAIYLIRPFDTDRNVNTPEVCRVADAEGKRSRVLIQKYKYFGLSGATRGVWFSFISDDNKIMEPCHVSLTEWGGFLKTGPKEEVPEDLYRMLESKTM